MHPLLSALFFTTTGLPVAQPPCAARLPMHVLADHGSEGGIELALDEASSRALASDERVVFASTPLPDGTFADLEVRRIELDTSELVVMVDGQRSRQEMGDSVMWMGRVVGDADSDVFLALSPLGSRGWIRRAGETFHLLAAPGASNDWTLSTSRLVAESALIAGGTRPFGCVGDALTPPGRRAAPPPTWNPGQQNLGGPGTTLTCRMAVETDYQLFQQFGNLGAEQTYVGQLLAAANARYVEQINTVLQYVYLAYYSNPNDPWVQADQGGSSVDVLYEFQGAWQFNLPNGANLAHFLSGGSLGGGVAWLDVLCDAQYGFAVSGNISGETQFPVTQGPTNWDFMVFTHETGHNFGTPHTHDFCPTPLDRCAPSGYFGQCQTQQVCITNGTLMSYCHLCPGGMSSVYPYFHQACADVMRSRAESTCLGSWCTQPVTYCPATNNSTGLPGDIGSTGSQSISANTFTLVSTNLPHNKTAFFFYGNQAVQVPLANGWRCVGGSIFRLLPAQNTGNSGAISRLVNFSVAPAGSGPGKIEPGTTRYFQAYYRDPAAGGAALNLSESLEVRFCP